MKTAPPKVIGILLTALCLQIGWRAGVPAPAANAAALRPPPSAASLKLLSFGEPIALSAMLTLYLQAFDNPPGISIPFRDLDYSRVGEWLGAALDLDPRSQYPLMMASQLYAQVPAEQKQRQMIDFVYRRFWEDPHLRWRWLAHAAIVAKHRLGDLPLALRCAQAIASFPDSPSIPHWAQQMPIFILEDLGELESAKILLGGLLQSGKITDPHEIHFLTQRLEALSNAEKSAAATKK